jgi:hypothetical protein
MSQENVGGNRPHARPSEWRSGEGAFMVLWSAPAALLLAAAAYEATLLVDLWGIYPASPQDGFIDAEETVASLAHLTMLVGSVFAFVHAFYPRVPWAVALTAPAAAAFVTTRFYTYDPYFLPNTLRRYSDNGGVASDWVLGMLVAALVVGALTRLLPPIGSVATAFILPVLLMTSLLVSAGH